MSYQSDRDHFIATMARNGVPDHVARLIMRHAATIERCNELACSSEAADRDRVRCPGVHPGESSCLCRDYGSNDGDTHGEVPRYAVTSDRRERRISALLAPFGVRAKIGGDPRGYCVKLHLPSGAYNTWGGADDGFGVPTRN